MAIARKNINSEDDFLKVGPDATATFDNSPSNPTEHAGSENLRTPEVEEDDLEEEDDEEEDFDDEEDEDEEEEEDEEEGYEDEDEIDDEEEDEEEDEDLVTGPKPPRAYKKV